MNIQEPMFTQMAELWSEVNEYSGTYVLHTCTTKSSCMLSDNGTWKNILSASEFNYTYTSLAFTLPEDGDINTGLKRYMINWSIFILI